MPFTRACRRKQSAAQQPLALPFVVSFLSLDECLQVLRYSKVWGEIIINDPRWTPWLQLQAEHVSGKAGIKLYCDYRRWTDKRAKLRFRLSMAQICDSPREVKKVVTEITKMNTVLNGFYLMSPFFFGAGERKAASKWMTRAVREEGKQKQSRFLSPRKRHSDFRHWISASVQDLAYGHKGNSAMNLTIRLVDLNGSLHGLELPKFDDPGILELTRYVAEAYLGKEVKLIEVKNFEVAKKWLRYCPAHLPEKVVQFQADALCPLVTGDQEEEDNGTMINVVRAHMFPGHQEFAWAYTAWIHACDEDTETETETEGQQLVSVRQIEAYAEKKEDVPISIACSVLYAAFSQATCLTCCENSPCVMNNCDGVEEAKDQTLMLCPACLRALDITGALGPGGADRAVNDLYTIFKKNEQDFPRETRILEEWGVGDDA